MGFGASASSVPMALQGVGVGMTALGSYDQASQQQGALSYESQVFNNNAVLTGYQASVAKQVGAQQLQTTQLNTANLYGAQRASMAANGVDLGSGSANDVLTSTKMLGNIDALTVQDNTNRQVWSLNNQATNYRNEAAMYASAAGNINPGLRGFTSLLSGAGTFAANNATTVASWFS